MNKQRQFDVWLLWFKEMLKLFSHKTYILHWRAVNSLNCRWQKGMLTSVAQRNCLFL